MRHDVTKKEIVEAFGTDVFTGRYENNKTRYRVDFDDDMILTYEVMQKFSELFKTRAINVKYTAETGGYSEYTPGDPSDFELVIG